MDFHVVFTAAMLLCTSTSREVPQGAYTWQKKISAAADGNKLGQARNTAPQIAVVGHRETAGNRAAEYRLAIPKERVALSA